MTRGMVLAIDDDIDCLEMMQHMLRQMGFSVASARSGEEGLMMIAKARPSVVLLDLLMPGMDGFDVLGRLKENPETRSIPVVIVSARGKDDDLLAGYVAGADYYVSKPFTTSQLQYGIEMVLGSLAKTAVVDAVEPAVDPASRHH